MKKLDVLIAVGCASGSGETKFCISAIHKMLVASGIPVLSAWIWIPVRGSTECEGKSGSQYGEVLSARKGKAQFFPLQGKGFFVN